MSVVSAIAVRFGTVTLNAMTLHPLSLVVVVFVAGAGGLEPPTYGFGDRRSTD